MAMAARRQRRGTDTTSPSLPSLGRARRTARVALLSAGARLGLYAAPLLVVAALGAGPWLYGYAAALAAAAVFAGALEPRAARRAAQCFGYGPRAVRRL